MQIIPVESFDLVIIGATGDLARRKIFPSLFRRFIAGQMPDTARLIGAARSDYSRDEFKSEIRNALITFAQKDARNEKLLSQFINLIDYNKVDAKGDEGWQELRMKLRPNVIQAFYFSVGPSLFGTIAENLKKFKCADENTRIVVEKPFGKDLETAKQLNQDLAQNFQESQIYRIDHYLGKETVQNLMAIRFGNAMFEPIWNSRFIDHVQITVAEDISVAGRGGYYDQSGAMRDMVQNHIMQLICLTAMEAPSRFAANAVRDEKLKVIHALSDVACDNLVRGQYLAGDGEGSYLEHAENPTSSTESYIAMRVEVQNWRWAGVPFYLRTGKRLATRASEIVVKFKKPPHSIFGSETSLPGNTLVIRLQPDEGITLNVTIKEPGPGGMRMKEVPLDMTFAEALGDDADFPDAYERLIMDVIRGNQTLFMRGDEVEAAWQWADKLISTFDEPALRPHSYAALSEGPVEANEILARDGRQWRKIG